MFDAWRNDDDPRLRAVQAAPYALPRGAAALERPPQRWRSWALSGGALLATACGGFALGRLTRVEPAVIERAQEAARFSEEELLAVSSPVILAGRQAPDDAAVATALDRLARRALELPGEEGQQLARRLLAALASGARSLEPHRAALEKRARRGA
jgi:hypothetical protein